MAEDFYEVLARMNVTTEYDWCPQCFERACDDGMKTCHPCAAERTP